MQIRLDELAEKVGGVLHGDPTRICQGANPPEQASADEVTMIQDERAARDFGPLDAVAVIVPRLLDSYPNDQIVVPDPHEAFAQAVGFFRPPCDAALPGVGVDSKAQIATSAKVHPTATVCAGARIGERTLVMPGVVVMPGCEIGSDCVLFPGVTLYEYTRIGDRVVIHAGSTLGAYGFGYRQQAGRHIRLAQLGYVSVESDVEIGAGVTIDRGSYGATRIGEGTKIDNQVMIAHNCQIGRHNLICSQVGIAGSCQTGDYVILAGQVGLKDHVKLGDHAVVGAQAGVMDDCEGNQVYLGAPAIPQRDQMQIFAVQRKLPEMRRELKALRKQVAQLSERLTGLAAAGGSEQADRAA